MAQHRRFMSEQTAGGAHKLPSPPTYDHQVAKPSPKHFPDDAPGVRTAGRQPADPPRRPYLGRTGNMLLRRPRRGCIWNWRSSSTSALETVLAKNCAEWLGRAAMTAGAQTGPIWREHQFATLLQPSRQPAQPWPLGIEGLQAHPWLGGYLFHPWPDHAQTTQGPPHGICTVAGLPRRDWPAFVGKARPAAGNASPDMPGWSAGLLSARANAWRPEQLAHWLTELPSPGPPSCCG
ncbi:hypothetical protein FQR65_LT20369 [Abscondita terminalis]|nr:hypothetical protein FQR65_LT20369 [Abscondita terminalis]